MPTRLICCSFLFITGVITNIRLPGVASEHCANYIRSSRLGFTRSVYITFDGKNGRISHSTKHFRPELRPSRPNPKKRLTSIFSSLKTPEKIDIFVDDADKKSVADTGLSDSAYEWTPWNEVALAADIKAGFKSRTPTSTLKHGVDEMIMSRTFDDSSPSVLQEDVGIQVRPDNNKGFQQADEIWRSELFFKSDNDMSVLYSLSTTSDQFGVADFQFQFPAAVAEDGYSAAEWLVSRRKSINAKSMRLSSQNERGGIKWSVYDHEAIAAHYSRRPLTVALRLLEASVAFVTWSVHRNLSSCFSLFHKFSSLS
jgi:hypothetical protein